MASSAGARIGTRSEIGSGHLERHGALLAAVAAGAASLPGLGFPFLSDDWILAAQVAAPIPQATALGYFRPLYVATFWFDRRLWGLSPALFHATNLVLIAACAALVVAAVRRYTRDPLLAAATGFFFAIHPYHVENAAWVAVRGDPLYASLLILAALAYDRWRERFAPFARGPLRGGLGDLIWKRGRPSDQGRGAPGRGSFPLPVAALLLFEAALLSKESAVILPAALVAIGLLDRSRRPGAGEIVLGLSPMIALALFHFGLLRPWASGGRPRAIEQGVWTDWIKRVPAYGVASVLPADVEIIGARPLFWAALAASLLGALALLAWRRSGRVPHVALAAAVVFMVLIVPSVVGFQERYLFLAAAATAAGLASLALALGGRLAVLATTLLAAGWLGALGLQWSYWREAAVAGRHLVGDLAAASRRAGVGEILVANMPFRVRGGGVYVYDDFLPALALSGGNPVPVRAVAFVSIPWAHADALDGPPETAIVRPPYDDSVAEVRLRVREGPFSHYAGVRPSGASRSVDVAGGTAWFESDGSILVRIPRAPERGRAAYAWVGGRLTELF